MPRLGPPRLELGAPVVSVTTHIPTATATRSIGRKMAASRRARAAKALGNGEEWPSIRRQRRENGGGFCDGG